MRSAILPAVAAALLAAVSSDAAAQTVVACRDRNMNIVPCESGGGGYTDYSNMGGIGGLGYALGYGIGTFFRSIFDPGTYADPGAQAAADEAARRAEQAAYERQAFLADQDRRRQDAAAQQSSFADQQRDLVGAVRPLGGESGTGALQQLRTIELGVRDIRAAPPEAASAAAGGGFDRGGASPLPAGPLMQVQGVPKVDPNLQPMTMDQRALVAEGRERQKKLDELRAKKAKGEIESRAAEAEEAAHLDALNGLAARFAALTPPPSMPSGRTGAPANMVGGTAAGSCMVSDPATAGCLQIRNATSQRLRVTIRELPGVFCTIEPGTYCARPAARGLYRGYAELDDGRRTSDATLDLTPQGLSWTVTGP